MPGAGGEARAAARPAPFIRPVSARVSAPDAPSLDADRAAAARARGIEIVLRPGDMLWMPRGWWYVVQQLPRGMPNLSLSFWSDDTPPFGETPSYRARRRHRSRRPSDHATRWVSQQSRTASTTRRRPSGATMRRRCASSKRVDGLRIGWVSEQQCIFELTYRAARAVRRA